MTKNTYLFCSTLLFASLTQAQQNTVAAGGVATGTGGSASFSIGQLIDNVNSDSNYSVTEGLQQPYEVYNPLPLQLLSFAATLQGNQTLLTWKTAHEQDVNSFEIEKKKANDASFSFLASVAAIGNNTSKGSYYQYIDQTPAEGVSYYRLKEVDNNGLFTYSQVVLVNLVHSPTTKLTVFPNPVLTQLKIAFQANQSKDYKLRLVNATGKTVIAKTVYCTEGLNTLQWNVAQLPGQIHLVAEGAGLSPVKILK